MSFEALWYRNYTVDGEPPRCRRLNRLPLDIQFFSATDLALAIVEGRAGYRPVYRNAWGKLIEYWYYWPNRWNERGDTGWWLVPHRVAQWAQQLIEAATVHECRRHNGRCDSEQIAHCIHIWQASGHWRRKVRGRSAKGVLGEGFGAWHQHMLGSRKRRKLEAGTGF